MTKKLTEMTADELNNLSVEEFSAAVQEVLASASNSIMSAEEGALRNQRMIKVLLVGIVVVGAMLGAALVTAKAR